MIVVSTHRDSLFIQQSNPVGVISEILEFRIIRLVRDYASAL